MDYTLCENRPKRTHFKDSSFWSSAEILKKAQVLLDKGPLLC